MGSTAVPEVTAEQYTIYHDTLTSPYSLGWWTTHTITDIPDLSVGWLVAQGWQITGVTYDATTVPPTAYYAMKRESLQNWQILESLLTTYVAKYNEALTNNATRYNDIISGWNSLIDTSHDHFDVQVTEQNARATVFLGNLDSYMNEVDTLIDANQTQIVADAATSEALGTSVRPIISPYSTSNVLVRS